MKNNIILFLKNLILFLYMLRGRRKGSQNRRRIVGALNLNILLKSKRI
jgi:hypothetical protein